MARCGMVRQKCGMRTTPVTPVMPVTPLIPVTLVVLMMLASLAAGCGGGGDATAADLRIGNNVAGKAATGVYVSAVDEVLLGAGGVNRLASAIAPGGSAEIGGISGGMYNAVALFDGGSFAYFEAFDVTEGRTTVWTVTDTGVPNCGLLYVENKQAGVLMTEFYCKLPAAAEWGSNMLGAGVAAGEGFYIVFNPPGGCNVRAVYSDGSQENKTVVVVEGAVTAVF